MKASEEAGNIVVATDIEIINGSLAIGSAAAKNPTSSKVKNLDLNFGGWTGDIGNKYTFWGNKDLDPKLVIDIITHDKSKENIEPDFNINDNVHNKKGCINADPTELENNNNFGGAALDTLDKEKVTLITNDGTNKEIGE